LFRGREGNQRPTNQVNIRVVAETIVKFAADPEAKAIAPSGRRRDGEVHAFGELRVPDALGGCVLLSPQRGYARRTPSDPAGVIALRGMRGIEAAPRRGCLHPKVTDASGRGSVSYAGVVPGKGGCVGMS
jgi:hypothetical protein